MPPKETPIPVEKPLVESNVVIKDIRRGKGEYSHNIYAKLYDADTGELIIAATLSYITHRILQSVDEKYNFS